MSDLQGAIECLKKSQHYQDLADFAEDGLLFNLFEVMGVRYRELTHSSVLAWLLSDEANIDFTKKFLDWIADKGEFNDKMKGKIANFQTSGDTKVICEYGDSESRIDVFAHFKSLELVIGIEVKVWAGEQERQVERYQCFLKKEHSKDTKIVIFLTPWGYEPSTAIECRDVPVVCMSWGDIVEIINEVNHVRISEKAGEKYDFRKQFSQHIERNILIGAKVRELLSKEENATAVQEIISVQPSGNEATIQKIIDNIPPITDYLDEWKEIVAKVCGVGIASIKEDDVEILHGWHGGGELKIHIKKWNKSSLPFTLMLYKYTNAAIRVLIWRDYLNPDKYEDIHDKLKLLENHSNGVVEYKRIRNWSTWRSVLVSDDVENWEDPKTRFNLYSENWQDEVEERLRSQLLELKNADRENLLQLPPLKVSE